MFLTAVFHNGVSHRVGIFSCTLTILYPVLVLFPSAVLAECTTVRQEKTGLEAQHRNKINAEINRYQAMVQEKEELSRKWDEQVL